MESLSDLKLSSSLSEDLICLFNLFALFLFLFICQVVKRLSSNSSSCLGLSDLSGTKGGGGGGLVGFGGLVRGTAGTGGGGIACAVSKAISSAFLNLEYLLNPRSFAGAFGSCTFMFSILYVVKWTKFFAKKTSHQ